jgi:Tfp pilus assembly protein PilV
MDLAMTAHAGKFPEPWIEEQGISLVETMISVVILVVALLSMAQLLAISLVMNKNGGRDATRTTVFAQDKVEELSSLVFSDTTTNITVDPPYPSNGTGLTSGGSTSPAAPVTGYADYLDSSGARTAGADAAFTRRWQIIDESAKLKRILVSVTSNKSFRFGKIPETIIALYRGSS